MVCRIICMYLSNLGLISAPVSVDPRSLLCGKQQFPIIKMFLQYIRGKILKQKAVCNSLIIVYVT